MKALMRLCILGLFLFVFTGTAGAIDLYDGRVVIHGKWSNQMLMRAKNGENYERD